MSDKKSKVTTIQVKPETKKRLMKYGKMGMSFDDVINYILDVVEGKKKLEEKVEVK